MFQRYQFLIKIQKSNRFFKTKSFELSVLSKRKERGNRVNRVNGVNVLSVKVESVKLNRFER